MAVSVENLAPVVVAVVLFGGMGYAGWRLLQRGLRQRRRKRLLDRLDPTPLGAVSRDDGFVQVSGEARPAEEGTIEATIVGTDALLVETVVESPTRNKRGHEWTSDHESVDSVPFLLTDETGTVRVDPPEAAEVTLETDATEQVTFESLAITRPGDMADHVPEGVQAYVRTHDTAPTATRRYRQGAVTPGEEVSIIAEAVDGPVGHDRPDVTLTGDEAPAAVTISNKDDLAVELGVSWVLLVMFGGWALVVVVGFGLLYLASKLP